MSLKKQIDKIKKVGFFSLPLSEKMKSGRDFLINPNFSSVDFFFLFWKEKAKSFQILTILLLWNIIKILWRVRPFW